MPENDTNTPADGIDPLGPIREAPEPTLTLIKEVLKYEKRTLNVPGSFAYRDLRQIIEDAVT